LPSTLTRPVSAVVVDTSVWIDFFAGRPAERLEEALRVGSVMVPPIVVAELLSGAKGRARVAMIDLLSDLELAASPLAHWIAVGDLKATLARRGLTVSTPDAHVAQCALDHDALLLSEDAIFTRIASVTALRVTKG
jgi:tRNA(fMet)-specific endonuclease VapC